MHARLGVLEGLHHALNALAELVCDVERAQVHARLCPRRQADAEVSVDTGRIPRGGVILDIDVRIAPVAREQCEPQVVAVVVAVLAAHREAVGAIHNLDAVLG